jgi:hypothetical protein
MFPDLLTFKTITEEVDILENLLPLHVFFQVKPPLVLFFTLNLTSQAMLLICNPKAKYL